MRFKKGDDILYDIGHSKGRAKILGKVNNNGMFVEQDRLSANKQSMPAGACFFCRFLHMKPTGKYYAFNNGVTKGVGRFLGNVGKGMMLKVEENFYGRNSFQVNSEIYVENPIKTVKVNAEHSVLRKIDEWISEDEVFSFISQLEKLGYDEIKVSFV